MSPLQGGHVVISVNPQAGKTSSLDRVERLYCLLRDAGLRTELIDDLDEVIGRAAAVYADGRLRALVGVGGDGTAAELVNRTPPGLPITLLPAGNENLLARYLSLGSAPESICRAIMQGTLLRLDAAAANGRVFLLMMGCGFDAEVVRRVHARRTGHIRKLTYFKPMLAAIRSYQYPALRAQLEVQPGEATSRGGDVLEARWLFAFNLPCYGGGLRIVPQADGADGLLDVCGFRHGGLLRGLGLAGALLLGCHRRMAGWMCRRAARLRVTSDATVPYQLDGDPGGFLPVDVEMLPGRLAVVVPTDRAEALVGRTA